MSRNTRKHAQRTNLLYLFAGLVIGGLAAAGIVLIRGTQSNKGAAPRGEVYLGDDSPSLEEIFNRGLAEVAP